MMLGMESSRMYLGTKIVSVGELRDSPARLRSHPCVRVDVWQMIFLHLVVIKAVDNTSIDCRYTLRTAVCICVHEIDACMYVCMYVCTCIEGKRRMTLEECPWSDGSTDLGTVESEQCSYHTEVRIF